jgi:multidrug efflux pump subunit AcrB
MVMFFLVVTGMYSLVAIPKESSPEVIIPVGIVSTVLRGAGAEDTEKLITDKVEEEIINLENIDKVTSSSREGISIVTAQFTANANIEKSIQDLKDAVDKAKVNFPSDANEPTVTKVNFSDQPILIISISDDRSPAALTALGNDLKKEIKKINGVSKVEVAGTRAREVQVVVSKEKLTEYNISLNQVIQAVGSSNTSLPVGNITVSQINYPIKFSGEITTANELADVAVTTINGVPVYLRDIAFIADGLEVPSTYSRVSEHGDPSEQALTLNIYKKSGGDVTKIARDVKKQIEELQKTTLLNAQVVISFDRGSLVERDQVVM